MNAIIDSKIESVFDLLPGCGYSKKVCDAIIEWYHR